jgi:hypothetical protein
MLLAWISSCAIALGSQSVSLQWNPNTDTNVAGYALYIGTTSGDYTSRIDVGTNTVSTISGLTNGTTYYFVTTDYDSEDVESTPSNQAEYVTPTNNPPVLNAISNYNVGALSNLLINTTATDSVRTNQLTFSLGSGAPTNMYIDPTNGELEWMVPLTAAGTTNSVTVQVTDNGTPPQSASQTFTITVSNYVQLSFGQSIVPLGQTNSVPLILTSSGSVTNVSFVLNVPANRMTNLSVTSLVPTIATVSQGTNGAAHSVVTIKALSGQSLQGQVTVGQLNYKAITNLPSCFAVLNATGITATQSNGVPILSTINGLGHAVLIGSQPLMQSFIMTNKQQNVMVYGTAGTNYQLQSRIGLVGTWTNEPAPAAVMPTNLFFTFSNVPPAASQKYYRVHAM